MPLVSDHYRPPFLFRSGHFNTIYPTLFRKVPKLNYHRKRYELPDGDFIDVDFLQKNNQDLVVIQHGLEGNSQSTYIRGMAYYLSQHHYDIAVVNFRGCSGEYNRLPSSYHSCSIQDLDYVVKKLSKSNYHNIYLVGFSLGGNQILYYLGKQATKLPNKLQAAVCISVPVDLIGGARQLARLKNFIYMKRFILYLKNKIFYKAKIFPEKVMVNGFRKVKTFHEFDRLYTAPLHGFSDEYHYWSQCSSLPVLANIKTPTLLINAGDDSFLSKASYPEKIAVKSKFFHFEKTKYGGHCGYHLPGGIYYSDLRCLQFFNEIRLKKIKKLPA